MTGEEKVKTIHEILDLVLRINGGAIVRKGKGHPTAFFSYSGHINIVTVDIHKDGWGDGEKPYIMWFRLDDPDKRYYNYPFNMNLYEALDKLREIAIETETKNEACD